MMYTKNGEGAEALRVLWGLYYSAATDSYIFLNTGLKTTGSRMLNYMLA